MNRLHVWKATLLVVALLLLADWAVSSRLFAAEAISLAPHWKQGDKLKYELVRSREKTQEGAPKSESTTRTDLEVEVLEATKSGYRIGWTYGETKFDDPAQARHPIMQKMSNLLKGHRVILKLDPAGAILGIENWEERRDAANKAVTVMCDELKAAGVDETLIGNIRNQISSMYATEEQVAALSTAEAQLFFLPCSKAVSAGSPLKFEGSLPNPLGGEPFPAKAQLELKSADLKTGLAKLVWTQSLDPEKTRASMEKSMKAMLERLGKPVPAGDLAKAMTIDDQGTFDVALSTGWTQGFTFVRTMTVTAISQVDKTTMTRK